MLSKSSQRRRKAVRSSCLAGVGLGALIAASGAAWAAGFNGVPGTQDGSVTYNRAPPNTETITINGPGAVFLPPHTIILWSANADFLPATGSALFRAPTGSPFSVLNRISYAGPDPVTFNGTIEGRVTTVSGTEVGGRVGFEGTNAAGFVFGASANISVGQLWLRSGDSDPLTVLWDGALATNAPGLTVPITGRDNGLWLQNIIFTANSGTIGGTTGTWIALEDSTFDLKGTALTIPNIYMRDSTFTYTEGTPGAPGSRTLSQNWLFDSDNSFFIATGRSLTLSGALTAAAGLDIFKEDNGLLTLTGNNAGFLGTFVVSGGELRVNSALTGGFISMSAAGTLSGTSTVSGFDASAGGVIAPGSGGVGTLTTVGSAVFGAASTFQVQVTPGGADRLSVGGTATLGGTLQIVPTLGNYGFGTSFTLLSAAGGATGAFTTVTGNNFGPNYNSLITQNAQGVTIQLTANGILSALTPANATGNQRATLGMIDDAVDDGEAPASLAALLSLNDAGLLAAADALSGEAYASATRVALDDERLVREAALGRLRAAKGDGTAVWGQVFESWSKGQEDGNAAAYNRDITGFAAGVDTGLGGLGGDVRLGVLLHYGRSDITIDARASEADIQRTGIGLYGAAHFGAFRVGLGGVYSALDLDVDRRVAFSGFDESVNGNTDGTALQGFAEIAYRFDLADGSALEPFLQAGVTSVDLDGFAETGGDAALTIAGQENEITSVIAGLRVAGDVGGVQLGGMIGYRALSGDTSVAALVALDASPGNTTFISAAALDTSAVVASFDAGYAVSETAELSIGYSGVFAGSGDDHAAKASFSLRF